MRPPRNSFSIGTSATMPYKMSGNAGGNKRPKEPEAVSKPSENFSS